MLQRGSPYQIPMQSTKSSVVPITYSKEKCFSDTTVLKVNKVLISAESSHKISYLARSLFFEKHLK